MLPCAKPAPSMLFFKLFSYSGMDVQKFKAVPCVNFITVVMAETVTARLTKKLTVF